MAAQDRTGEARTREDRTGRDRTVEDLTGPDCHAVVVGTGHHTPGATLRDLPGAVRSAADLAAALTTTCGMAPDRVRLLTDPSGPTEVLAALEEALGRARSGIVVFAFVGHGLLGPGDRLYLATTPTTTPDSTLHAVPYTEISARLTEASARSVVVLDCCFSGLAEAAGTPQGPGPYAAARPHGSFLLASATHYAASFAPEGAQHTLFSGELLRLLTEGDAGGPRRFTLSDVYRHLDRRFQDSPARPHSGSVGRIGDLVLAPNPRHAPAAAPEHADAPEPDDTPCPYPGMRPFLTEQHHLYHGREQLTAALLRRVLGPDRVLEPDAATGPDAPAGYSDPAAPARHHAPVVLVGPSGAGKSSLLRAGLCAALDSAGAGPVLLVPAPSARPFRTLVDTWARAVGRTFGEVERDLGEGRFTAPPPGREPPGILVVDQLEEIFTHCRDSEERRLFARALAGTAGGGNPKPRIVLGLRADYFGHCLRDPQLAPLVADGQFAVPVMTDDELRAAIEGPAAQAGLRLETGLTEAMLRDLRHQRVGVGDAIALPFLAHALQETWARRRGPLLTHAAYQAAGGIHTSVATTADRVHDSLDADARAQLRAVLLHMVHLVDKEGTAVRRRVRLTDLGDGAPLVRQLADARLVIVDEGEAQLCHDSLLHGWPRLRDWINADLDRLLVLRRIGHAADAWEEAGRPRSGLYAGRHLAAARALTEPDATAAAAADGPGAPDASDQPGPPGPTDPPALRPVERDFLAAGEREQRRKRRTLITGVSLVCVLAVVSTLLAVFATVEQRKTQERETRLIAQQLATQADAMRERDPQTALQLSLAAYRAADTPETRSSLYTSYLSAVPVDLEGTRKTVLNVAFRADGRVLATGQAGGRVQLWDITRPALPARAGRFDFGSGAAVIAFHPRAPLLAAHSPTRLTLWDVADARRPRRLAEHPVPAGTTFSVAFSPDGRTLASGSADGRLRLWDLRDPSRPRLRAERRSAGADLMSVAFTRGGRSLLAGYGLP
ncbi:caspase, EACC1-associated type, partial [Streptomyces sp. 12297]